ncbi:MAG: hypothetical protein RIS94_1094 [Pseudomonadota bacterium]|jgi:hypothetical protein
MKAIKLAACASALAFVSGCAPMHGTAKGPDGHRADVPVATAVGPAVSCIPLAQISESRVRDDWTIDFRVAGNRWYRNSLPNRCNSLGFEKAFSYATSLSQLCNTDIITVIATGAGGGARGSCGLGQFQPVTLAR